MYGGIVPELASRNHVVTMMPVIERALAEAGCTLGDIGGIAVTRGPGLVGSLLVGLMCAKGLAQATGIPFVGVNHIEGHLLAPLLEHEIAMPYLALVVSGGHTALFVVEDFGRYRRLGSTRDDAAGEAFDKVAKLMGLGYPGGKIIDDLSQRGHPQGGENSARARERRSAGFQLQRRQDRGREFSRAARPARRPPREDLAASFQEAVVEMLIRPTHRGRARTGARHRRAHWRCRRELATA